MNYGELSANLAQMVKTVPGLDQFFITYKGDNNPYKAISAFRDKIESEGRLTEEIDLSLKILIERIEDIKEDSFEGLHYINHHLQVNDSIVLQEFFEDRRRLTTGGWRFKTAEKQHYKTITEKIGYQEIDYNSVIHKYIKSNHPYICSQIACAYLESKAYHIGLPFLQKALFHVFSSPNIYWHNVFGVQGCTDALFELQHLLGFRGMIELTPLKPFGILSCLYLYLSRAIYMCDNVTDDIAKDTIPQNAIMKINYLSLRGDLIYDYKNVFSKIFGMGVNPDIQFMSDKYLSHEEATRYGIQTITMQDYWDSMKMYRYGGLIPNDTGGYKEIEDSTWGELIQRGQLRSKEIAANLYKEYKSGAFVLDSSQLGEIIVSLRDKLFCYNSRKK